MLYRNDFYKDRYSVESTFEDLCDRLGIETVFSGTDVDEATQQALLNYFFDFEIADSDNKFLRRFRERLNRFYDQYLDEVRVLTVKKNFDPFVNQYFEDAKENSFRRNVDNSTTYGSKRSSKYDSETSNDLTETRDLQGTGHSEDNNNSTTNGKTRDYGVSYPEANMDVTLDIDSLPNIEYVSGENDGMAKSTTDENNTSDSNTTNTGTIKNDGTTKVGSTNTSEKTGTDTGSTQQADEGKEKWIRKGRDTSVQALLTTAVKAIEGTNALNFLITQLMPCFNTVLY